MPGHSRTGSQGRPRICAGDGGERLARREALDQIIAEFTRGWTPSRLSRVDRALLRLGAWELLGTEIPSAVAINEAVELAKAYGSADSPAFINGVLDSIRRRREDLAPRLEG